MSKNIISIIVAMARDRAIGANNRLLWRIKDDLRLFKKNTRNHVVIHGRKSFESVGKALVDRSNIIVSRTKDYDIPGCFTAHSLQEAFEIAERLEQKGEIFVLGGAEIYRQAFPYADRLYISHVEAVFPKADTHFPEFDFSEWQSKAIFKTIANEDNEYAFECRLYNRIKAPISRNNAGME